MSCTKIIVSLQTIVTLVLLQLPAVGLAIYGVVCALKQRRIRDKFSDSLLAITLLFLPFCLTELFALLQFEFCGKCSVTSFDLLKFLPSRDPKGKDR